MPQISQRAVQMPASPIRKLVPLAEAAAARGTKIYHLNIGQPDLPTPEVGLQALKHIDRKVLEYSPSDGYRSLREKLVSYYEQYQIKLTPDEIIVTAGGSEAVLFAFMTCLNPGDEIIVPEPAYANYMAFAVSAGAVIRPVVSTIDNGFALPPVEEFERLINSRTRGILICNPNNPTGYLYTRREMERIRDLVRKYDLFLFSDIYTGSPYVSACHLEGIEQNVVLIDSVSKRYSECGIRIGALITKNRELRNAVMKFCQARLSPPLIGQIVAEASIDAPRSYQHGGLRGVHRAPQMPDRRAEPHPGRLLAHPDGGVLHRGAPAGRGQRRLLRLVPARIQLRGPDRDARPGVGLLLRPRLRPQRGPHRLCPQEGGARTGTRRAAEGPRSLQQPGKIGTRTRYTPAAFVPCGIGPASPAPDRIRSRDARTPRRPHSRNPFPAASVPRDTPPGDTPPLQGQSPAAYTSFAASALRCGCRFFVAAFRHPPYRPKLCHRVQFSRNSEQNVWTMRIVFLLLPPIFAPARWCGQY